MMTNEQRGNRGAGILYIMLQRYETQDREEALREFLRDLLHTGYFYPNELISQLNSAIHHEAECEESE